VQSFFPGFFFLFFNLGNMILAHIKGFSEENGPNLPDFKHNKLKNQ